MPASATPTGRTAIVRAAVGIGVYAGAFGLTFGAVAVADGLSRGQAQALSLVMFSGASQFALSGVVGSGGSAWTALGPTLLLALRNGFYGVTLAPVLQARGWRRLVTAHLVIDETTAMANAQPLPAEKRAAFWWTGVVLLVCWNAGTFLGGLVGSAVDTDALGLDAAGPAVFLALLWPALSRVRARWVALAGALVALALVPFVPGGVPVLVACAGSYLIKLAGLSLPESVLAHPRVQRVTTLLPVAMLAALVVVQLVDGGGRYVVDWRVVVGVSAGAVALLLRRGFLVVFVVAVGVTALLRLLT